MLSTRVLAIDEVVDDEGDDRSKRVKLKTGRSRGQNLFKSQKLSKLGKSKCEKSKKLLKSRNSPNFDLIKAELSFLTPGAREAFNCLWLAFTKAPILWYFDPKYHIWIEIDTLSYVIGSILSQLASGNMPDGIVTKADLGQWHPVAFFSRKIIPAETWYKTYNGKLLAIIEAFKTWHHYLENYKHEVFIFTDHNKLRHFMDIKTLSFRQVCWA